MIRPGVALEREAGGARLAPGATPSAATTTSNLLAQRRRAVDRRGPAGAGAGGEVGEEPARGKPTLYFNVPRGFDMLLPFLEKDEPGARILRPPAHGVLRRRGAGAVELGSGWSGGAQRCARSRCGSPPWGSTETSPPSPARTGSSRAPVASAMPLPGMELKFIPTARSWRCACAARSSPATATHRRSPRRPSTRRATYRIGDAGSWSTTTGLSAASSSTAAWRKTSESSPRAPGCRWARCGLKVVSALAPLVQDAVVTGHDRGEVGVLLFASPAAASSVRPNSPSARARRVAGAAQRRRRPRRRWRARLWLAEPPNADAGEITDKGWHQPGRWYCAAVRPRSTRFYAATPEARYALVKPVRAELVEAPRAPELAEGLSLSKPFDTAPRQARSPAQGERGFHTRRTPMARGLFQSFSDT